MTPPSRILLVEDYPESADAARQLLELRGHAVQVVPCAADALSVLHAGESFDLLITDLNLPDLRGDHLARRIADLENRPRAMIGVSGDTWPGEDGPCDLLLQKPLRPKAFIDAVERLLAMKAA